MTLALDDAQICVLCEKDDLLPISGKLVLCLRWASTSQIENTFRFPSFPVELKPRAGHYPVSLSVISTILSHNCPGDSCEMNSAQSST